MNIVISCSDAQARGLKRYFTGRPCPNGHIAERGVSNRGCMECARLISLKYRISHPEKTKAATARWRAANSEKISAYAKRYASLHPDRILSNNRKSKGLPKISRPCPLTCECCGQPPGKRALHLDHDHGTGKFRGWLCHWCNVGIGNLGDDIKGVKRALTYLERTQ